MREVLEVQWYTRACGGAVALQGSESARQSSLEFGRQEHAELGDDAACDQLMRGYVKRRVPHIDTCGKRQRIETTLFIQFY